MSKDKLLQDLQVATGKFHKFLACMFDVLEDNDADNQAVEETTLCLLEKAILLGRIVTNHYVLICQHGEMDANFIKAKEEHKSYVDDLHTKYKVLLVEYHK